MINLTDQQILETFSTYDRSLNSVRQAVLTLFEQQIELLRVLSDIRGDQLQMQQHKRSIDAALDNAIRCMKL